MSVTWISGKVPKAYFRDAAGNTIEEYDLPDMDTEDLIPWMAERGFAAKKKPESDL
eukprot:CAMPEP_0172728984 /NCGR_PEP_ID=MMETSP1074-20121228/93377_1 /TAXON_ID=2916 /ORGANISM="Ceratium fusus, Strain PA161109" /LENGTH=55 /DNA_ID=CAMNT_0013556325 /DNA_START=159 /DNA_END=326 /DNA_ORIENTATION=+